MHPYTRRIADQIGESGNPPCPPGFVFNGEYEIGALEVVPDYQVSITHDVTFRNGPGCDNVADFIERRVCLFRRDIVVPIPNWHEFFPIVLLLREWLNGWAVFGQTRDNGFMITAYMKNPERLQEVLDLPSIAKLILTNKELFDMELSMDQGVDK